MTKTTMTKTNFSLRAVALAACCGALLAGCGGSSDTIESKPPMQVALPANLPSDYAPASTGAPVTIPAGGSRTMGGVIFSCASGGDDCEVTVLANGDVQSTGGTVTAVLTQAARDYLDLKDEVDAQNTRNEAVTAVETAVKDAEVGASELTIDDSTEDDENRVDNLITTAEGLVTSETALTDAERIEFNRRLAAVQQTVTSNRNGRAQKKVETAVKDAEAEAFTLNIDSTEADESVVNDLITTAGNLVTSETALTNDQRAAFNNRLDVVREAVTTNREERNQKKIDEDKRAADQKAQEDRQKAVEMADTVYHGIGRNPLNFTVGSEEFRTAGYDARGDRFLVFYDGPDLDTTLEVPGGQVLREDEMLDPLDGWDGKKYVASGGAVTGMYEAHVYSRSPEYEEQITYQRRYGNSRTSGILSDNRLPLVTSALGGENSGLYNPRTGEFNSKLEFDFNDDSLPTPVGGENAVKDLRERKSGSAVGLFEFIGSGASLSFRGSFDGAMGTYLCTRPLTSSTAPDGCGIEITTNGFDLGFYNYDTAGRPVFTRSSGTPTGVDWFFVAEDPTSDIVSTPTASISYGWWMYNGPDPDERNGDDYVVVSAFDSADGDVGWILPGGMPAGGYAAYVGSAAGKYVLNRESDDKPDSGHFTAKATIQASFGGATPLINGIIDTFVGADGQSRPWSVELLNKNINVTAPAIGSAIDPPGATTTTGTTWTVDGNTSSAAGRWNAQLWNNDISTTPSMVTGTFSSEYDGGNSRMVGAFGAIWDAEATDATGGSDF